MADSLLSSLPGAGMPANDLASKATTAKNVQRPDSVDLLALLRQSLTEGTQTPAAIMQAATEAAMRDAGRGHCSRRTRWWCGWSEAEPARAVFLCERALRAEEA